MKYLTYLLLISSSRAIKLMMDEVPNIDQMLELENSVASEAAEKLESDFYANPEEENLIEESQDKENKEDDFIEL